MPQFTDLPLFPLGLVLYPGEQLPLHIFEPRYREMVARCLEEEIPFGIVFTSEERLARVGCTARIENVLKRYEDGQMDIVVRGEARFHIARINSVHAYLTAEGETISEPREDVQRDLMERAITQHMRLLELAGRTVRPALYNEPDVSYVLAHNAGLSNDQKQEVLELLTENLRIAYLISHFETLIPRVEQVEEIRRKVQTNGHFKDFPSTPS